MRRKLQNTKAQEAAPRDARCSLSEAMHYVAVAVNVPTVTEVFHYHLPEGLVGVVRPGHLVEVPFGRQQVQGVVLRAVDQPEVAETRPVTGLVDVDAALTAHQLLLAERMTSQSLTPLSAWIRLMLPPGLGQQADLLYERVEPAASQASSAGELSATQKRVLDLLARRGALRGRQIDAALPHVDWRAAARTLIRKRALVTHPVLPGPGVRRQHVRTARLATSWQQVEASLSSLGREGTAAFERRLAMLRYLHGERQAVDVAWIYAASRGTASDLRRLAELGWVVFDQAETYRDPLAGKSGALSQAPTLTHDQERCWEVIRERLHAASGEAAPRPLLLHGVTGSGKTELYLRAVAEILAQGRQAIVLVPEIALTPQTVDRFLSRFPGQVGLAHSQLSPGERYDTWRRARNGELNLVVGPRSALFMPLPNPGLIVLDECHDDSYYQTEPPFYDARQAAIEYAALTGGVCLMGSATPRVVDRYQAESGRVEYLALPARILGHRQAVHAATAQTGGSSRYLPLEGEAEAIGLPEVQVVDMRQELKSGNRSMFSRELQRRLGTALERQQQAILFLNRRGSATYVFCRDCGFTLRCPRCELPLTAHLHKGRDGEAGEAAETLTCHHCGYRRKLPSRCPQCGGTRIRQYGAGTEKVEAEVRALFPEARLLRWDYESTRTKGAHELILEAFSQHRADILIGTQMLAKGLDLPLVTLVGVVLADVGLNLPDFRAAERTFQVLTQVAGRAGRSPLGGGVVLQTFQPEHYAIQAAARHDYEAFYRQELAHRKELGYPPLTRLARLEYRHTDSRRAEEAAQQLAAQIKTWASAEGKQLELVGPAPCFFARLGGAYRWQIVLRGNDLAGLLRGRDLGDWRVELEPPSLL